jgi:hypothetical protein
MHNGPRLGWPRLSALGRAESTRARTAGYSMRNPEIARLTWGAGAACYLLVTAGYRCFERKVGMRAGT